MKFLSLVLITLLFLSGCMGDKAEPDHIDFDQDGIPNTEDEDDDNDGVLDITDAFPLDASESTDSDGDGVGDNGDAYPSDSLCQSAVTGGQLGCYFLELGRNNSKSLLKVSEEGEFTFYIQPQEQIIRLSKEGAELERKRVLAPALKDIAYVKAHQRYYLLAEDSLGEILTLDPISNGELMAFTHANTDFKTISQLLQSRVEMKVLGNFIALFSESAYEIYDDSGDSTFIELEGLFIEPDLATRSIWTSLTNKLFVLPQRTQAGGYITSLSVDSVTGSGSLNRSVFLESSARAASLSPDGSRIAIDGNGYLNTATETLESVGSNFHFSDAVWTDQGTLVTVSDNSGSAIVRHWLEDVVVEEISISGEPIRILGSGEVFYLVSRDTSGPKITEYRPSNDIDGDGVANAEDAYPSDPAASVDSDLDGFPEHWNEGKSESDSTGGLTLDQFPGERECWLTEHASDDGTCDYGATIPNSFEVVGFELGLSGVAYIASPNIIYRWSTDREKYLKPIRLPSSVPISSIELNNNNGDLYLAQESSISLLEMENGAKLSQEGYPALQSFATSQPISSHPISSHPISSMTVGAAGLFAYAANRIVHFDLFGNQLEGIIVSTGGSMALQASTNTLYFTTVPYDPYLYFRQYNDAGEQSHMGRSLLHPGNRYNGPIAAHVEQNLLLSGSGDLIDTSKIQPVLLGSSEYFQFDQAQWLNNGELVLLRNNEETTTLQRYSSNLDIRFDEITFNGNVLALQTDGVQIFALIQSTNGIEVIAYKTSQDTDGDGVDNQDDAFPIDPAASIDTDQDGFPDQWNTGYNENDSTSGLILDLFPTDAECWLSSHGTGSGTCDYSTNMPSIDASVDKIKIANGIFYLLSAETNKIYRWNAQTRSYLPPINATRGLLNHGPISMAVVTSHNRIYLGYGDGEIRSIDLGAPKSLQYFAEVDGAHSLFDTGNFLYVAHSGYRTVFDLNGTVVDSEYFGYSLSASAWDGTRERFYYFTPGGPLYSHVIDQTNGLINDVAKYTAPSGQRFSSPLIVSHDGSSLLFGSGALFSVDSNSITWLRNIDYFNAGTWMENGDLVRVFKTQRGSEFSLLRSDSNLTLERLDFGSNFLTLIPIENHFEIAVMEEEGKLSFIHYEPSNDNDADGVDNLDDAFPLDPSASVDSDRDGYPDLWNEGFDSSNLGLILDIFPMDAACWLPSHDDGSGMCKYSAALPLVSIGAANQFILGDDGIVYIHIPGSGNIYRWNTESQRYMNPIPVGTEFGVEHYTPSNIEYSSHHSRLYLAYSEGKINYIDLTEPFLEEQFFTSLFNLSSEVNLSSADNFLLVHSNQSLTAYDVNGIPAEEEATTIGLGFLVYSTWNPLLSRSYNVYSRSPYLKVLSVDPITGEILNQGTSPTKVKGSILVSPNGQTVVAGNGVILDAQTLTDQGTLDPFSLGSWLPSGELVTLIQEDNPRDIRYLLKRKSSDLLSTLEETHIDGRVLSVHWTGESLLIIKLESGYPAFETYAPNTDSDSDDFKNN